MWSGSINGIIRNIKSSKKIFHLTQFPHNYKQPAYLVEENCVYFSDSFVINK